MIGVRMGKRKPQRQPRNHVAISFVGITQRGDEPHSKFFAREKPHHLGTSLSTYIELPLVDSRLAKFPGVSRMLKGLESGAYYSPLHQAEVLTV